MISPLPVRIWQGFAQPSGAARNGFAKPAFGAQHEGVVWSHACSAKHLIPTPSLALRSGHFAGPRLSLRAVHRQSVAGFGAHVKKCDASPLSKGVKALDSWGITTPNGGSLRCVKPRSFLPFSPRRPLLAACRPMASAPLPALPLAPSLPMRPTTTCLRAPQLAVRAARCATTWAFVTKALRRDIGRAARLGGADPVCELAIGAPCSGGLFVSSITIAKITKGGAERSAPEGRGLTCSRRS